MAGWLGPQLARGPAPPSGRNGRNRGVAAPSAAQSPAAGSTPRAGSDQDGPGAAPPAALTRTNRRSCPPGRRRQRRPSATTKRPARENLERRDRFDRAHVLDRHLRPRRRSPIAARHRVRRPATAPMGALTSSGCEGSVLLQNGSNEAKLQQGVLAHLGDLPRHADGSANLPHHAPRQTRVAPQQTRVERGLEVPGLTSGALLLVSIEIAPRRGVEVQLDVFPQPTAI